MKVNFVDLPAQYRFLKANVIQDFADTIFKGNFIGSEEFEKEFADYHDINHCVGVGSGTDALLLALLALGIGPGDEVIVPANTYIATAFAVSHTGATPVFVDPDPDTYVMATDNLVGVLTANTKAIIPVHLYGQPVNMPQIMLFADAYNLKVIEDCAQSAGADIDGNKTGTFGHAGCYSFYPAKNLGGMGQGGAVVTQIPEVAVAVRELGNVGRKDGSWFDYIHTGYNSRLDGVNARFLSRCLTELDIWNNFRRLAALSYEENLATVEEVTTPPDVFAPVYHLYELKCADKVTRDNLKSFLSAREIGCSLHYPIPCHKQPVYEYLNASCPVSEELSDTLLSLPMHPNLKEEEIKFVCDSIKEFYNGLK